MANALSAAEPNQWNLEYDRVAVAKVVESGGLDVEDSIARAVEGHNNGLEVVREIVQTVSCESVWLGGSYSNRVDVSADFTCDGEGYLVNDGCLSLSVYLPAGVCVSDPGLRRLTDLPVSEFVSVYDVLDGVVALLNESVSRARNAFHSEPVRGTAAEHSDRSATEPANGRHSAIDNGRDLDDDDEIVLETHIAIACREDHLIVRWDNGASSVVERDDPETSDMYETLCDALDMIEMHCPFHEGDQRDATACNCADSTVEAEA
ncbi:hypothetical protein [Rhodococcus pyridinivorans]|uniref:hypothetical protein n=1 Tax=Rhodococcus pyridinivorans TaxID=103816 RepID=UPI002659B876|nr:hypothetical protein [Rhodococcus pyridinivorans]